MTSKAQRENLNMAKCQEFFDVSLSNHSLIYAVLRLQCPRFSPEAVLKRHFKHYDPGLFSADVATVPFHVAGIFDDPEDVCWAWGKLSSDALEVHAPVKRSISKRQHVPFMTAKLLGSIRHRNKLRKLFFETKDSGDREKYRIQRNFTPSLRRRGLFKLSPVKSRSFHLKENGVLVTDKKGVAETFKNYFSLIQNVGDEHNSDSNVAVDLSGHPSIVAIRKECIAAQFEFDHVSVAETGLILKSLDPNKATGHEQIPARVLRDGASVLAAPVTHLKQLVHYFDLHLSKFLSAYRKGYSCESGLLNLIEDWKEASVKNFVVGSVLMDLSKAFDLIPHDLLLSKLSAYGVSTHSLNLLKSCLTNRRQQVRVEDVTSDTSYVNSGIPQGSVSGPLLSNIFINDLSYFMKEAKLSNYGDDNQLYFADTNPAVVEHVVNKELVVVFEWFRNNKMILNPAKCKAMVLSRKPNVKLSLFGEDPPTIQIATASSRTSWVGQTVTFKCQSDGVPTPKLTWYQPDGSEIKRDTNKEITVQVTLNESGDFGYYKCLAENGLTPRDEEVVKINQIEKPGQAFIISTEADVRARSLTIRWTAPADDGGSPITAYRLVVLKDYTEITRINITGLQKTNHTFTGLERETNYTVKVFARNYVFEGDAAVKTLKTKFEGPPEVVKIDELPTETKDNTITLKWEEPGSNGKVIALYTAYQRTVTDGKVGDWKEIGNITNVKDRQLEVKLKKGEVYEFAITATNVLGEGLKQDALKIKRVKAIGIPETVEIYDLPSKATEDTITLRWNEPQDNGKKITQYTVYQRTKADERPGEWTIIKEISDVKVRDFKVKLERGKVYLFAVTATNDVGESLIPDERNIPQVKAVRISGKREVSLTATINENCSRRLFVAAKFPNVACELIVNLGCFAALAVDSRCGSVIINFIMYFNQSVATSTVLTSLKNAAKQNKFGVFKVDPASIKQVSLPNVAGPEECNCPCNGVKAIIGALAFMILLLIICIIWLYKRGAVRKQRTYEDERGVYDNEMELKDLQSSLPDSSKLTQPPAEHMDLREASRGNRKAPSAALGANYAPLHPLTRSWEVSRVHVTIEKVIGKGAFGQVARGTAIELRGRPEATTVAIKMLKVNASESDKQDLMKELETMKQLKPHPHVIKLLGCVTESGGSPYPRMSGRKIANLLQQGYRMPKPQHVDDKLYQIMKRCWQNEPDARPTFTNLKNQLKDLETFHKRLINMEMYDKHLYANVEDLTV
ncbi:Titin [Stylophora pistillata]|uniref:Titin n=1 Tax=Stylophora pistillata TaxID=50429 RepID=A0A2B4RET2_STYPI|nr:Titin [Stylophora pistillata]